MYLLLTRLGSRLAHNELLLDEGLGVNWLVTFLLGTVLSHVLISASEELGAIVLHGGLLVLGLHSVERQYQTS